MNKTIKQKRCPHCLEMFEPKRNGLAVTKICGSAACVLDAAQNFNAKVAKPKPVKKKPKTLGKLKKGIMGRIQPSSKAGTQSGWRMVPMLHL